LDESTSVVSGVDGCANAATGSLGTFDELGAADPALREPGSPLVCSVICSFTLKTSGKS
jgi:hypothetical protein